MRAPNLQDVDLRQLRVFQAVSRNRGFAAAQDELGVTQATISNQIAQLEQRLGVRLCERGRSGFALTDEGKTILDASLNLFRSIENFRSIISATRGEIAGEVNFGTVDAMWTNREIKLQTAFARFAEQAPRVTVRTDIAAPQALFQGLAEDRYHLILAPAQQVPSRFRAVMMFEERQSLYCGREHVLFGVRDSQISAAELAALPFAARAYMADWIGPLQYRFTNPAAMTSHMESLALLLLSGKYIGYLPNHFADYWVRRGEMRCLLDTEASYQDRFYLAFHKRERNRAVKILFDLIRALVTQNRDAIEVT